MWCDKGKQTEHCDRELGKDNRMCSLRPRISPRFAVLQKDITKDIKTMFLKSIDLSLTYLPALSMIWPNLSFMNPYCFSVTLSKMPINLCLIIHPKFIKLNEQLYQESIIFLFEHQNTWPIRL